MPYRERRKSVVDMLAKVPVHRGSLLRSLDDLLKTIEISESTVMIPTLLRDKCQFDAWELLFVAKILKASILGHSDLVEFYMNHMGNQASIQQHQQELNKANSSSHEQLLRNKTASHSSSNLTANQQSNLQQQQLSQPQTPSSEQLDSITIQAEKNHPTINNNIICKQESNNFEETQLHQQQQQNQNLNQSQEFHSASSSITSNGITSWMSAASTNTSANGQSQDVVNDEVCKNKVANNDEDEQDDDATLTPINDSLNFDLPPTTSRSNSNLVSSCHSISEETAIEMSTNVKKNNEIDSDNDNDDNNQLKKQTNESPLLMMAAKPPNRLQLPPTPSNPHDQLNGNSPNNPHSGLAESPMSLSQNNIEQLASRFETRDTASSSKINNLKPNSLDLNERNIIQDIYNQQFCSPTLTTTSTTTPTTTSSTWLNGTNPVGINIALGASSNNDIILPMTSHDSANVIANGLITNDERLIRNCRSTSCLSRINSGASSPHGNHTPATANGLHPINTTPIETPVAGSLAAALNSVGSEPVADPASAPVKLLLQIEQLKTSINQVRNLLESVVELYKNSIDNLAVN